MLDCYWLVVQYYLRCSIISFTTHHCYTVTALQATQCTYVAAQETQFCQLLSLVFN